MQRSRPAAKPRQHARRRAKAPGRNAPLDLDRFVPYRIATLGNLLVRSGSKVYARRFGLAIREWRILAVLGEGRPLSEVEIVRRGRVRGELRKTQDRVEEVRRMGFAFGVAGAPALDPFAFGPDDVAITRDPASHPLAFRNGSAMELGDKLQDHLCINIHLTLH